MNFKHFITFFLFLLCVSFVSQAQDYQVSVIVRHLPEKASPMLLRMYNGNLFMVDSVPEHRGDTLLFRVPADTRTGMLRAILGAPAFSQFTRKPPVSFDFLFIQENSSFSLDFNHPDTSMEVIASEENRIYFDFLRQDASFLKKLALLEQVAATYPDQDDYYQKTLEQYKKIQIQRDQYIDKTIKRHPDQFSSRIIKNLRLPLQDGSVPPAVRDSLLTENYLSQVDFSDTLLLYTSVYTDKVFRYIQMAIKRNASPRENEANCIRALDKLVPLLDVNPEVQQNLLRFLVDGFERTKMEEVLAHISDHYLSQCGGSAEIIKRRLEGYHKMAIGQKAPDFTVYDIHNQPVNLYSQLAPYTLLLFWHTGCGHCQTLMEQLPEMEKEQLFSGLQLKIIGISIDDNEEDWKKFSENYALDWINTHESGFESQIATDYNLFATPTLFLLDENHQILAKPTTLQELRGDLEKIK